MSNLALTIVPGTQHVQYLLCYWQLYLWATTCVEHVLTGCQLGLLPLWAP